jgi:thymidylate synthase ThyX
MNNSHISAKIISYSLNSVTGAKLATLELEYPRYIHSELMTHRVFSRNASSSRAIPIERSIEKLKEDNWYPIFMQNKKGMAATEELSHSELLSAMSLWDECKRKAILNATYFKQLGVHKQIVNRILEPYSLIKVILTATDFDNFFKLRISPAAQQEIQALASNIKEAIDTSEPIILKPGEWHIPYIFPDESDKPLGYKLAVSAARCARVSYLNHDGIRDSGEDINLHNTLLEEGHFSPFEHQARAIDTYEYCANFYSFQQYRHQLYLTKGII